MTREELYSTIYTHETIYRPPEEANSALLEVALGCSWGKCAFCDFAKDPFSVLPMDQIRYNARVLGRLEPEKTRVFLLGENALSLGMDKLREIFAIIRENMPQVTEVAMYARVDDVQRKTDQDLAELHQLGLKAVHVGVESGSDCILLDMNKGVTSFDMVTQFARLDTAGIEYFVTVILGLGGRTFRNLHALETARLLNRCHPKQIWCLALKLWPDTPLYKRWKRGEFEMMTPREMLVEERILVEALTVTDCHYMDTTVLQQFTIQGFLPENKDAILRAIDRLLG